MISETVKSFGTKPSKSAMRAGPSTLSAGGAKSNADSRFIPRKNSRTPLIAVARWVMTAEAAYYIAERRGFAPGHELEDWLLAEKQIDAKLSSEAPPGPAAASVGSLPRWSDL